MTTTKRNVLSHKEAFKLATWLTANIERIKGLTQPAIAELAAKDLRFEINGRNISNALDVAGLDIGRRNQAGTGKVDRVVTVARALVDLHKALGMPVPEQLQWVANNSSYR